MVLTFLLGNLRLAAVAESPWALVLLPMAKQEMCACWSVLELEAAPLVAWCYPPAPPQVSAARVAVSRLQAVMAAKAAMFLLPAAQAMKATAVASHF